MKTRTLAALGLMFSLLACVSPHSPQPGPSPPESPLLGHYLYCSDASSWTLSLTPDGTYTGVVRGGRSTRCEVGTWRVWGAHLRLAGEGELAALAGPSGFLLGHIEGRATLTSKPAQLTFFPVEIAAAHLPNVLPQGERDEQGGELQLAVAEAHDRRRPR
ncbi:MAG: hypothetical protein H8D72_01765 [Planctomycetes bacterium]|nr:hypothetical protein [Planctomycetota bacterium]